MIDKKKAEVGRRRRFLGKMEKKFRGKLLLLGCLLLAIIPSIVYADYFDSLKVETFPITPHTEAIHWGHALFTAPSSRCRAFQSAATWNLFRESARGGTKRLSSAAQI